MVSGSTVAFELVVTLTVEALVLIAVVLAMTMLLFLKLRLPYTLAVEIHGILSVVVFRWELAHSGVELFTHGTVVFTQLVCFSFEQGTVVVALATHITAPLLVHKDVVLDGQKDPASPTQPTIAFCCISATLGTFWLLW